jgi:hypothetical protein
MALATNARLKISISLYKCHRFPPEIIQYAQWLYHRFKSAQQAQRILSAHAAVYNLFNLGRHLVSAKGIDKLTRRRGLALPDGARNAL